MAIGDIKSTAGTINHFTEAVSSSLLGKNEVGSTNPTSFMNLYLDQIGSMVSANFYEFLMVKQESTKYTAKTRRSLVRNLDSTQLTGIFGNPSVFTFTVGFPIKELLDGGVSQNENLKKVTINKNTIISLMDKPEFTMDYGIDIYIRFAGNLSNPAERLDPAKYTYFAKYVDDVSDVTPPLSNPFVKSYFQRIDNVDHFMMKIQMKQYSRKIIDMESMNISQKEYEINVPYMDNLYAFEVLYKEKFENEFRILKGTPDGVVNTGGYNFSLNDRILSNKSYTIKFHRDSSNFSPARGSFLKIVTYTTKGEDGNFFINNWNTETPPINEITFVQERDIPEQDAIFLMYPAVSINGPEAVNGRNEMELDDLRNYVIRKSDSKNVTLSELELIAKEYGMRITKERFDILDIYFKTIGFLEYQGSQILTIPGTVRVSDSNSLITPKNFFRSGQDGVFKQSTVTILPEDYVKDFNNTSLSNREYFFPYFMFFNVENHYVNSRVLDMAINQTYPTIFEYYNEGSVSEAGINLLAVRRNPLSMISGNDSETYKFVFNLQISELFNPDQILNKEQIDIKIVIKSVYKDYKYSIKRDNILITEISDGFYKVEGSVVTDNTFNSLEGLAITDGVEEFPKNDYSIKDKYYIDSEIDVDIVVSFIGTTPEDNPKYSNYLSLSDRAMGFRDISVVYSVTNISLFKDLTDIIRPIVDLKSNNTEYLKYTAEDFENPTDSMYERYDSIVYDTNPDGSIKKDKNLIIDSNNVPREYEMNKVLHRKGEIKLNDAGLPKFKYDIGDVKVDENGNQIPVFTDMIYEVREIPLIDRIYFGSGYETVMNALNDMVSRVDSWLSVSPTGSSAKLGVYNTVAGNYYYIDVDNNKKELLKSLALTLKIGVKLETDDLDETIIKSAIIAEIVKYIRSASTSNEVSFVEMLDYVRSKVIGVKYFELYKVNDIPYGRCNTVYHDNDIVDDGVITIKNKVANENLEDIRNGNIIFKPDIDIKIIK